MIDAPLDPNLKAMIENFLNCQRSTIMAIEAQPHLLTRGLNDIWDCTEKIAKFMELTLCSRRELTEISALYDMFHIKS